MGKGKEQESLSVTKCVSRFTCILYFIEVSPATVNMYSFEFAADDIMKIIRYAQVMKPIELRTFVESELKKILLNYEFEK